MKAWVAFALTAVIAAVTTNAAHATKMGVGIADTLSIDFKTVSVEEKGNVIVVHLGAYNTGSIEYDVRARVDIMSGSNVLFTGWSEIKEFNPGDKKGFVVYGYKPDADNLSIRARVYYGNEIKELEPLYVEKREQTTPKTAFSVSNFRVYDNYIRFDLFSNQSVENVLVLPNNYPVSWIFNQKRIERIEKNTIKEVIIPYESKFFHRQRISIIVTTEDGGYYQQWEFGMQRERGIMKYIHLIMDILGSVFRA